MSEAKLISGEIRKLVKRYTAGGRGSHNAFYDFVSRILHCTVLKQNQVVRLSEGLTPSHFVIGGSKGSTVPLRLNDGRYLRLMIVLWHDSELKRFVVEQASYQYQPEQDDNRRWIFRYDYLRTPSSQYPHPQSHLHVNAKLPHGSWSQSDLHKIHFPVGNTSLESVIRVLAQDFKVPCRKPTDIWQPVLAESEKLFQV